MPFTAQTTELEAVNAVLNLMGESAVDSLTGGPQIVAGCRTALDEADRRGQTRGWWFNRARGVLRSPNGSDEIDFSGESEAILALRVITPTWLQRKCFLKGTKLYDPTTESTTVFTSDVEFDLIKLVAWDDLPQSFRDYVVAMAALEVQKAYFGTETLAQIIATRMSNTEATLMAEDVRMENASMLGTENAQRVYGIPRRDRWTY